MNLRALKFILAALAILGLAVYACSGQTIKKFSDYVEATSLSDTWILPVELPATTPPYKYFTLATLRTFLNDTGPNILTFTSDAASNEIGSTVAATTLSWTLSGSTPTSQSINQGIGAIPVGTLTANYGTPLTANKTFTLTALNAAGTDAATTTVAFYYKAYWGPSAEPSLDDAEIIALSSEFGSARARTKTVICNAQYMYFAYPAAWGAATFIVNGLQNTAWQLTTRDFVNASGATVSMRIYRSDNLLTGSYIVEIQ